MSLLTEVFVDPARLANLSNSEWDQLLRFARYGRLLGSIRQLVTELSLDTEIPEVAQDVLSSDTMFVNYLQLQATREVNALEQVLGTADYPVVLLKGTAYIAARLPPAAGRRLSDIDILVPREHIEDAEQKLKAHGWKSEDKLTEYDQHYYRDWSHEVPPMRHQARHMEVDLHHSLTPPTGRIKLASPLLFEALEPLDSSPFYTLSPQDMFLHSAVHLFINDELRGGLRDLVDMHLLVAEFGVKPLFWENLIVRAERLDLTRPLYYALTGLQRLLHTEVPAATLAQVEDYAPGAISRLVMAFWIDRALAPTDTASLQAPLIEWLLFIRSHWIRMPPRMLAGHLWRKWRYQRSNEFDQQ